MATIRPYRPADRAAVYDVCVRTADAGGDARGRWSTDDLMPDLFAGPYVDLEPVRAFVLDDGGRVVGYVIGTADTPAFVRTWREEWVPRLAERYPVPPDPPRTPEEEMLALGHRPERMLLPELAPYPAHLHIDLLPSHQRAGHGRALVDTFRAAVAAAGAPALHLGMVTTNRAARAFYDRLGFTEIAVPDAGPVTYLGIRTR
ncbi:GNAT family N-acetyltransferase [Modestobacter muralis]|uniref:GNAT family N-acetyltransferase n=1 Tax=Modestobacter muralis TaxID=1608614 RepID=A0A6P0H195_9ACTN|nr:GNAT family N-acetyltransferase [Modestobacter muralis]NEK92663.1 GNAT family N-acetyltransferase [Modestobacter muralis]NEN49430.1 GNAT family N-acetyltransferase [Modestobacter muralis]